MQFWTEVSSRLPAMQKRLSKEGPSDLDPLAPKHLALCNFASVSVFSCFQQLHLDRIFQFHRFERIRHQRLTIESHHL